MNAWVMWALGIVGAVMVSSMLGSSGGGISGNGTAVRTPVTPQTMYGGLNVLWSTVTGQAATNLSILTLMAQWGLETANGDSMFNYNFGNFVSAGGNGVPSGAFFTITPNGVTTPMKFASYDNFGDGLQAYLSGMYNHFSDAWQAGVVTGDLDAFSQALYDAGYYGREAAGQTQEEFVSQYAEGMKTRRAQLASALSITLNA